MNQIQISKSISSGSPYRADHNAACNIKARFWAEVAKDHNRASKHCTKNADGKGHLGVEVSLYPVMTRVMVT